VSNTFVLLWDTFICYIFFQLQKLLNKKRRRSSNTSATRLLNQTGNSSNMITSRLLIHLSSLRYNRKSTKARPFSKTSLHYIIWWLGLFNLMATYNDNSIYFFLLYFIFQLNCFKEPHCQFYESHKYLIRKIFYTLYM